MLHMALVFLVVGIIAALLGFTTIAGASFAVAKFLAGLFLLLFLVFLVIGIATASLRRAGVWDRQSSLSAHERLFPMRSTSLEISIPRA